MIAADYNMSNDLQAQTLAIVIILVALAIWGIWAVAVDIKDRWSIEDVEADVDDTARDYYIGRDLHTDDRDAMRKARGL